MFMGEFHHNIDEKKRLIIPSKFREELNNKMILTRGLDGCLFIYTEIEWEKVVSKLKKLPFTKKDARSFMRFFLSGATECELDKQGRIKVSGPLSSYAKLKKECIIIGVNDRLEIWAKENFENFISDNEENLSDIAENLFDGDFDI